MLSPDAMTVLQARYLHEGETADDMFWRVATHVAQAEKNYGKLDAKQLAADFYQLLASLAFLPNSPTLMNAGKKNAQLAACFVLPISDSLNDIFDTLKHMAIIQQSGGGTGFAFSRVRPRGDHVASTNGAASGPVSFMQIFDATTQVVKQGSVRRGANMAVLRVDHPDIREFINAKRQTDALTNFNLSVGITDQFMQSVLSNDYYALVNPRTGRSVETLPAQAIFAAIVQRAWENGEPGLFFLDTVNRANPTPALGSFESPNPCSEQPLLPYESCVLGSINLTKMVRRVETDWIIDYAKLKATIRQAVRFLDDVIEVNIYPIAAVAEATKLTRKIGLGVMGLAELFIMLNLPYGSEAATKLTRNLLRYITHQARQMSQELADERGSFPAFGQSCFVDTYPALRNATVTTIAPTGTLSIIANCSSGIEPLFGLSLAKHVMEGQTLTTVNRVVLDYLAERDLLSNSILDAINQHGSVANTDLPDDVKAVLATAHEITPFWHVAQLSAAQRYTDNGVSKTVNLPHGAQPDDVAKVFIQAFTSGCKGITVYRDASRAQQVLTSGVGGCPTCDNF